MQKHVFVLPTLFKCGTVLKNASVKPLFVKETKKPIGGVGMTLRWSFRCLGKDLSGATEVIITNVSNKKQFLEAIQEIPVDVMECTETCIDKNLGFCATLVFKSSN